MGVVKGSAADRLVAVDDKDRVADIGNLEARGTRAKHRRQIMMLALECEYEFGDGVSSSF